MSMNSGFFKPSAVSNEDGENMVDAERSSESLPLGINQDAVVKAVEDRVCQTLAINRTQVEQQQIVFYKNGASFGLHHDSGTVIDGSDEDVLSSHLVDRKNITVTVTQPKRSVTIFAYLNSLPNGQGGETRFPFLGLDVTPTAGDAIMFCNLLPNGTADVNTCHEALPVKGDLMKLGLVRGIRSYIYFVIPYLWYLYHAHIA